jgi:hypothetical protein
MTSDVPVRCRCGRVRGVRGSAAWIPTNASSGGALADTPFAILFFRYVMPAPTGWSTTAAYAWVQASGVVSSLYDYNNSGVHNTVTKTGTGSYTVNITGATYINASIRARAPHRAGRGPPPSGATRRPAM